MVSTDFSIGQRIIYDVVAGMIGIVSCYTFIHPSITGSEWIQKVVINASALIYSNTASELKFGGEIYFSIQVAQHPLVFIAALGTVRTRDGIFPILEGI